jgi:hypothetical protein
MSPSPVRVAMRSRVPFGDNVNGLFLHGGPRVRIHLPPAGSPRKRDPLFKSAHQWQRAVHNELCDRRNDQVLDVAKFKQGDGANEAGFAGIAPKKLLEIKAIPSSVPARESWALYRKAARHLRTPASRRPDTLSSDNDPTSLQMHRCHETRTNQPTIWAQ